MYLDDISVLSGTVDTGTLDYYSQGQPVSPWLATGLTAEGVWNAQTSSFTSSNGTFGQLLGDSLVANYADVSGGTPTTTVFNTNLTSTTDDYFNNGVIIFTEGNNTGVVRRISDYGGASKTITVDGALPFAPAEGDRFAILAATATTGTTAADIWSYTLRSLTDANLGIGGSLATKADVQGLSTITAAEIWSYADRSITGVGSSASQSMFDTACSVLSSTGSIGKKVCDNLDAAVSSRSNLTAANIWEYADRTVLGLGNTALYAIWNYETRELTSAGSTLTAADVWNTLTSSLILTDSIGRLLVTNVDDQISERATQTSLNTMAGNVATTSALIDTSISSRASQSSFDTHETAESAFRTATTTTLGLMTTNIAAIQSDLSDIETKIDSLVTDINSIESQIATIGAAIASIDGDIDKKSSDIYNKVSDVSTSLQTVTDRIGKVSVDSFTQLFEIKKTDIDYLKNKVIELKAVADIDRQLLEKTVNQPITKVIMEWGSVIIKFVIVNPSDSVTQKIPFKAFLPKEVKQEYIMDLGGLNLNYDTATEQYYVTADINLKSGESVTRAVEIKDIWIVSEDEVTSLRKQAEEMSNGLKGTSYFAQGLTLKTDINTRLDKVLRKQKDSSATPQDHILAYRENMEDTKAVTENLKGLKDLVLNSGAGKNFLASVGGIQTFATWGIVLVLIFGMGILGSFYYSLWKRKVIIIAAGKAKKAEKKKLIELPTPAPWQLPGFNLRWIGNIFAGLFFLIASLFSLIGNLFKNIHSFLSGVPKKTLILFFISLSVAGLLAGGVYFSQDAIRKNILSAKKESVLSPEVPKAESKVASALTERLKKLKEEEIQKEVSALLEKTATSSASVSTPAAKIAEKENGKENILGTKSKFKLLAIKQTPTDFLNVRSEPLLSSSVVTKVYPGETYPFSEAQNGWFKILLKDLKEGWVSGQYVRIETENIAEQKTVEVAPPENGGINIRQSPNGTSKVVKTLFIKNKYQMLGKQNGWVKIELLDGKSGWVSGEFVTELASK